MKISNVIYNLFFAAVAILALLLIASVLPIPGNFKVLTVLSGSMEPTIHTGSVIIVKPPSASSGHEPEYKVGDVITFGQISKTKTPTTHRIMEVKENGGLISYVTKGDANENADFRDIRKSEVIGKELFSVPYVGYAITAARTKYGFFLIIIIPALIIIGDEIRKMRLNWQEMKRSQLNKV